MIRNEIDDIVKLAERDFPGPMRGVLQRAWRWQKDGTRYSNEDVDLLQQLRSQYEGRVASMTYGSVGTHLKELKWVTLLIALPTRDSID